MTKTGNRFNQFLLYLVGVMLMLALCVTFRNNTILMTVKKIGNPWLCLSCLLLSYDGWKNFYQTGYRYYLLIGCNIENIIMKYYKYCIKSFYIIFLLSIMMIFDVENPIKSVLFQLLYFVTMLFVFPPISYILLIGKNKQRRCVEMVLPEILLSGVCAYLFVNVKRSIAFLYAIQIPAYLLLRERILENLDDPIEIHSSLNISKQIALIRKVPVAVEYNIELYFSKISNVIIYILMLISLVTSSFMIFEPIAPLIIIFTIIMFIVNASIKDVFSKEFYAKKMYKTLGVEYKNYLVNKIKCLCVLDVPLVIIMVAKCIICGAYLELLIALSYSIFVVIFMPIVYSLLWMKMKVRQTFEHTLFDYLTIACQFVYPAVCIALIHLYRAGEREWSQYVGD